MHPPLHLQCCASDTSSFPFALSYACLEATTMQKDCACSRSITECSDNQILMFFWWYEVHSTILFVIKFMQSSHLVFLLSRYESFRKSTHYDLFLYTICYLVFVVQNRSNINYSFLAATNINNHLLKSRTHVIQTASLLPDVQAYLLLPIPRNKYNSCPRLVIVDKLQDKARLLALESSQSIPYHWI